MAISTTTQTLNDGPRNLIVHWTGISDGSGQENKVRKVDVSKLTPPCGSVKITKISGNVEFGIVELFWDGLDPKKFMELSGQVDLCFDKSGGLANNLATKNGDMLLSTEAFELNSSYDLLIEMVKKP